MVINAIFNSMGRKNSPRKESSLAVVKVISFVKKSCMPFYILAEHNWESQYNKAQI